MGLIRAPKQPRRPGQLSTRAPAAMPLRLGVSPIFLNPLRITFNQFLPMHSIPVSFAKMSFDERTFDVPERSFRDEP